MDLRSIKKEKASKLRENNTITSIKIETLKPLIKDCTLMVMETEKREINIKLVYEEAKTSCMGGGNTKLKKQQLLLNILLD